MKATLSALRGDFRAEAEISLLLSNWSVKDFAYHHLAYDIACVYALEGKSHEAVKWLRETAATGVQPYPMFERGAYLNRIIQAREFIEFMAEMKTAGRATSASSVKAQRDDRRGDLPLPDSQQTRRGRDG